MYSYYTCIIIGRIIGCIIGRKRIKYFWIWARTQNNDLHEIQREITSQVWEAGCNCARAHAGLKSVDKEQRTHQVVVLVSGGRRRHAIRGTRKAEVLFLIFAARATSPAAHRFKQLGLQHTNRKTSFLKIQKQNRWAAATGWLLLPLCDFACTQPIYFCPQLPTIVYMCSHRHIQSVSRLLGLHSL